MVVSCGEFFLGRCRVVPYYYCGSQPGGNEKAPDGLWGFHSGVGLTGDLPDSSNDPSKLSVQKSIVVIPLLDET
jgi:hypothetical protein